VVMNCDTFLLHSSGTVGSGNVHACTGYLNVGPCVNWASANIPTRGLRETNNCWNEPAANVFIGHTAASARVMRRANFSDSINMSETAIVP
jgi:hypothetical protein